MKKCKSSKGITLVALVITIIILLILAGISISVLTNQGLFQKAQKAKERTKEAEQEQSQTLGEYEREINKYVAEELKNDKINVVLSEEENTLLKDAYGNVFTVPAGFKVTSDATTVDKGIVIEDVTVDSEGKPTPTNGSQFVWIPVGKIYTDSAKTEANAKTIELNRYAFDGEGKTTLQSDEKFQEFEALKDDIVGAKSISDFKNSVAKNGGYYIGRYEARTQTKRTNPKNAVTQITEKGTDQIYNFVTQSQAASQAKNMYNSNKYTSDLMNSYAWDTATVFIQNCTEQTNYANQPSLNQTGAPSQTGTNTLTNSAQIDKQCNIYDMASNIIEWTTEAWYAEYSGMYIGVFRGGYCYDKNTYMSGRGAIDISNSSVYIGFRPILYL